MPSRGSGGRRRNIPFDAMIISGVRCARGGGVGLRRRPLVTVAIAAGFVAGMAVPPTATAASPLDGGRSVDRGGLVSGLADAVASDPLKAASMLLSAHERATTTRLVHEAAAIDRARQLATAIGGGADVVTIARVATGARPIATVDGESTSPVPELAPVFGAFAVFQAAARTGDAPTIVNARQRLLEEAVAFAAANGSAAGPCNPVEQLPLYSIDLMGCDSTYESDVLLSIDVGGNDIYRNNAGGANAVRTLDGAPLVAAAAIDLSGDDTYGPNGGKFFGGANGGSAEGAGFLLDLAGDDTYAAGGYGANGGGDVGLGFLLDVDGSDVYTAGSYATNGGGMNGGTGMLIDLGAGHDTFTSRSGGTNGGGRSFGSGNLIDEGGNDRYEVAYSGSWGSGANGGTTTGGSGFLFDGGGDDVYRAPYGGSNGGSYDGGAGFLYDGSGSDNYEVDDGYGANGGVSASRLLTGHTASGLLVDAGGGADSYTSGNWGVNGGVATELRSGFAALIDAGGNDLYTAGGAGVNGGAKGQLASGFVSAALVDGGGNDTYQAGAAGTNGGAAGGYLGTLLVSGLLVDVAGDDSYTADNGSTNGGGWLGIGALVDLAGRDHYRSGDVGATDETVVPKGAAGAQFDAPG